MKITKIFYSFLTIVVAIATMTPSMAASVDMDHQRKLGVQKIKTRRFLDMMASENGNKTEVTDHPVNHNHDPKTLNRLQKSLNLQLTKGDGKRSLRHQYPHERRHLSTSFSSFCSTVERIYETAGFNCVCDAEDEYVACSAIVEGYYSTVILAYDSATKAYDFGIDCLCTNAACDISPTTCLIVTMQPSMVCAEMDIAVGVEETICHDCRICSTSSGLVELEANGCYGADYGCIQTFLLASLPGGGGPSPTPAPAPDSGNCATRGNICGFEPCCAGLSCTDRQAFFAHGVTLCE